MDLRRLRFRLGLLAMLAVAAPAQARTITLTADDCDQMAVISARAPRLGWTAVQANTSAYSAENSLQMFPDTALLMRFPLDAIPKNHRITKAELTLPTNYVAGSPQVSVRRLVADWGIGVCHQYRRTHPEKVEWTQAGGRGASTDRHNKDSAMFRFEKPGNHTVDVTEDIELWYTKAVPNRGWILVIENQTGTFYAPSPYSPHWDLGKQWKLQITFEPK